jgi:hypothetical protein
VKIYGNGRIFSSTKGEEMQLREYLEKHDMSITQFAKMINFNENYLAAVMRGWYKPGKKLMRTIEIVTQGMVRQDDIFNRNMSGDICCSRIKHDKNNR